MKRTTIVKICFGLVLIADMGFLYEYLFDDNLESLVFIVFLTFGLWLYVLTEALMEVKK